MALTMYQMPGHKVLELSLNYAFLVAWYVPSLCSWNQNYIREDRVTKVLRVWGPLELLLLQDSQVL